MKQTPPARKRVLVVDDSDIVRLYVAQVILELPLVCDVDTAANGPEGLERLQAHRYDLLITDLDMPGASGLEVARAAQSRGSFTAIVFMTGDLSPAREEQARRLSPIAILEKPFSVRQLIESSKLALDGEKRSPQ